MLNGRERCAERGTARALRPNHLDVAQAWIATVADRGDIDDFRADIYARICRSLLD
jgi:hypothetical protein